MIWTGGLNDRVRDRGPRRPVRHDAARRRADGRRRARAGAEARVARLLDGSASTGSRPVFPCLRRRLATRSELIAGAGLRRGLGLLARRPGRSRGARRARRTLLRDRVADLGPEARRDRRLARDDARRIASAMRFAAEHGIHAAFFGVDSTRAEPDFFRQVYETAVEAGGTRGRGRRHARDRLARGRDRPCRPHDPVARRHARALSRAQRLRPCDRERRRRGTRRRDLGARHDQRHGRAGRQREPRRGRPDAARPLRRRVDLRLDRIREVSARVRELSGYELEPWKPVTGETLYRRESGAVAVAVPRPAVDRAVLVGARRDRALDRARQEERARLDPHQGRGARPRRARGAARGGARRREAASGPRSAASSPTTSSGRSRVAEYDAVIVGSG